MKNLFFLLLILSSICSAGELIVCRHSELGEVAFIFGEDNLTLPTEALAVFESNRDVLQGLRELSLNKEPTFAQQFENALYHESYSTQNWSVLYDIEADIFQNPIVHIQYRDYQFKKCLRSKMAPMWLNQELVDIY